VITGERLRKLLDYNPETGVFVWRVSAGRRAKEGARAGHRLPSGYRVIQISGGYYREHRLAWLYMTGEWPPQEIDHRNLVRDDNRAKNLRLATSAQNQANKGVLPNNTSGFKGVSRAGGRWKAEIGIDGKRRYLGLFDTLVEAHDAYNEAARKAYGEFARAA
jgi:hypothetical protein